MINEEEFEITEVGNRKMARLCPRGITKITVNDSAANNRYELRVQRTSLGLGVMCFLDGRPSYQADRHDCGNMALYEVINLIAGGKILDQNGLIEE